MSRFGRRFVPRAVYPHRPTSAAFVLFNETFEGTGYSEVWSAAETIGTNCILDEDANPADVGNPPTFGSQCLKALVASPGTQAFRLHNFGVEHAKTFTRLEFILSEEALSDGGGFFVLVALNSSGTQTIWALLINQTAGALSLIAQIYHNGSANNFTYAGLEVGKRYRSEIQWDSVADTYAWRVDGEQQASGSLTGSAVGWGLQNLKLGLDAAAAQGSTVYFDNLQLRTETFPGPPIEAKPSATSLLWNERFETPAGTDETWSDGAETGAGNTVDSNQLVSGVTGAPATWDTECMRMVIGASDGLALQRHQFGAVKPVAYMRQSFIVGAEAMGAGLQVSLMALKETHASPEVPVVSIHLVENGGTRGLLARLGDGDYSASFATAVDLNTEHTIEIKYDGTNSYWAIWYDGALVLSGHIRSTWGQGVKVIVVGSSGGSTGRDVTCYFDNYLVSDNGFPILTLTGRADTCAFESSMVLSAQQIAVFESLLGLRAASLTPFEAAGTLIVQSAVPFEALLSLLSLSSTPFEALSALSRGDIALFEALSGATRSDAGPFEAAGTLQAAALAPYESGILIARSDVGRFESLSGISPAAVSAFEALGFVRPAVGLPFEAAGTLIIASVNPYETTASLARAFQTAFEALSGVTRNDAAAFEAMALTALELVANYESRGSLVLAILVPYEAVATTINRFLVVLAATVEPRVLAESSIAPRALSTPSIAPRVSGDPTIDED